MKEERKNRRKGLLIGIIAGAAALIGLGVGAFFLFRGNEPASPTGTPTEDTEFSSETEPETVQPDDEGNLVDQLFWNVDRVLFAGQTEAGVSSRTTEKDGFYHIQFAVNGRTVERRVRDKKLVNQIDALDLMGFEFDEEGVITGIRRIEEFTGGYEYQGYFVSGSDGNVIHLNTGATLNGMDFDFTAPEGVKIFNVSGSDNPVGFAVKPSDLKELDRVLAVKDKEGQIIAVFVTDRYEKTPVFWNVDRQWDDAIQASTRLPDAEGFYTFLMASNGEQIEVKTRSKTVTDDIERQPAKVVSLKFDKDGYAIAFVDVYAGGWFASWYHITELSSSKIKAYKYIEGSDKGSSDEGVLAADYECYDVSGVGDFIGQKYDDLKVGDQIHCVKNQKGEVQYVFVVGRTVDSEIYWNMKREADGKTHTTLKKPDANGYYWFDLAVNGSVKRFKTNLKEVADEMDYAPARVYGLQVEGDTVTKFYPAINVTGGGPTASWYTVMEKKSATEYVTKKLFAGSDKGRVTQIKLTADCKIYNVSDNELYDDHAGELLKELNIGDVVHCLTNLEGDVTYIMLITRAMQGEIYWNLDRQYDSKNQTTVRKPDAEGNYTLLMAVNGKQVTLKTKDKNLASQVDSYIAFCMCIEVSGDTIVRVGPTNTKFKTAGGVAASWYDVQSRNGNQFYAKKVIEGSDHGQERTLVMAANCEVYNVGSEYSVQGEKTDLRVGDRIHVLLNAEEQASIIYIVNRPGIQVKKTCPECGKEVTWISYSGGFADSTEVVNAAGQHVLHYFLEGDRSQSGQPGTLKNCEIHFDLNGHTLTGAKDNRTLTLFNENSTVRLFDLSSKKSGVLKSSNGKGKGTDSGTTEIGGAVWIRFGSGKLYVKDVTLDFSDMDQADTAGAVFIPSGAVAEFENVKIIPAKKAKSGAAIYSAGSLSLTDVTISGGTVTEGGTVVIEGGELSINGNTVIKDGKYAGGTDVNLFLASGMKIGTKSGITSGEGSIGITAASGGIFTEAGFEEYKDVFRSDEGAEITLTSRKELALLSGNLHMHSVGTLADIQAETGEQAYFEPFNADKILSNRGAAFHMYLTEDTVLNGALYVPDTTLVLCLNGHTLKSGVSRVIQNNGTAKNCEITICDCSSGQTGKMTGGCSDQGGTIWVPTDLCPLTIYGGTFTNEKASTNFAGGAVINAEIVNLYEGTVKDGVLNYGSEVTDRVYSLGGGNIRATVLNMYGGMIEGGVLTIERDQSETTSGSFQTTYGFGGNVYAGTLNLSGGVIKNGQLKLADGLSPVKWCSGGNVFVNNLNMTGGEISGGVSATFAGNVHITGTSTISGGVIKNGTAGQYGGNIALDQPSATLTITNAEILNGVSTASSGGNVRVKGTLVLGNGAAVKDGTAAVSAGNLLVESGTVTIEEGALIEGGQVDASGMEWKYGGSIAVVGNHVSSVVMNGGTIRGGNTNFGGSIYTCAATFTMNGGVIENGRSNQAGGHFFLDGGSAVTVNGGEIRNGTSGSVGGNFYVNNNAVLYVNGGKLYGGVMTGGDGSAPNVYVEAGGRLGVTGGTIVADESSTKNAIWMSSSATVSLENAKITRIWAQPGIAPFVKSGFYYTAPDASYLATGQGVKTLDTPETETVGGINCSFGFEVLPDILIITHNHCICGDGLLTASGHTHAETGWTSWKTLGTMPTVADCSDSVVHDAEGHYYFCLDNADSNGIVNLGTADWHPFGADGTGAGGKKLVICLNGLTVKSSAHRMVRMLSNSGADLTITDCKGTGTMKTVTEGTGGDQGAFLWLAADSGKFTLYNGTMDMSSRKVVFDGNGAFIDITGPCSFDMYGGTLIGGRYERNSGGSGVLLHLAGSQESNLYGGTLIGGQSDTRPGGAVFLRSGAKLNVQEGVVIRDGKSPFGGNIYTNGAVTLNLNGAVISGGTASNMGGNIFTEGGVVTMNGCTVKDGTAAGNGGNIRMEIGTLTINDGTLIENGSVPASGNAWKYGGNLAVSGNHTSAVIMNGGTIKGGQTNFGGNVYTCASTFTLNGGLIEGGTSNQAGGNFFLDGGSTVNVNGGEIRNGISGSVGGNFYVNNNTVLYVNGGKLYGGVMTGGDGSAPNVYVEAGGTLKVTEGCILEDEVSTKNAIWMSSSATVSLENAKITRVWAQPGITPFIKSGLFHEAPDASYLVSGSTRTGLESPEETNIGGTIYTFGWQIIAN